MDFAGSVFMTVGDACAPWHPQFFSVATFESQRLTQDGTTIDPGHGLRHCEFELATPWSSTAKTQHASSSYTISFTLACHRLGQGWDFDTIAKDVVELEYVLFQPWCQSHFMPAREKLSGRNMGHTCINFWAVGASKPSQNCDSDGVVCRDCFPGFSSAKVSRATHAPVQGLEGYRLLLSHGCLVQSTLHTSQSIRFKLGQKFVAISFTVLLTESGIAITNFSRGTS